MLRTVTLIALVLLYTGAPSRSAQTPPAKCHSQHELMVRAVKLHGRVYLAKPLVSARWISDINAIRQSNDDPPYDADTAAYGTFNKNGIEIVAFLLLKDRCMVPGTFRQMTRDQWEEGLRAFHIQDSDFEELRGL